MMVYERTLIFHFAIFKLNLKIHHTPNSINIMNQIKKIALAFFLSISFAAIAPVAIAEEAAVVSANKTPADVINHIELGLVEVQKSDFSAAYLHLKSARAASEAIQGNNPLVKQGFESVVQGQILVKQGDVAKATAELNKALSFYKQIK